MDATKASGSKCPSSRTTRGPCKGWCISRPSNTATAARTERVTSCIERALAVVRHRLHVHGTGVPSNYVHSLICMYVCVSHTNLQQMQLWFDLRKISLQIKKEMLTAGLEPATAALLAPRSNQLSYASEYKSDNCEFPAAYDQMQPEPDQATDLDSTPPQVSFHSILTSVELQCAVY